MLDNMPNFIGIRPLERMVLDGQLVPPLDMAGMKRENVIGKLVSNNFPGALKNRLF
jgi:hypothetical protein